MRVYGAPRYICDTYLDILPRKLIQIILNTSKVAEGVGRILKANFRQCRFFYINGNYGIIDKVEAIKFAVAPSIVGYGTILVENVFVHFSGVLESFFDFGISGIGKLL